MRFEIAGNVDSYGKIIISEARIREILMGSTSVFPEKEISSVEKIILRTIFHKFSELYFSYS